MGKRQSMRTVFALLALALAVYAVTEVQELGNTDATTSAHQTADLSAEDDDDGLGEGTGRGMGAFLSTTGSFTLSSGNNMGNEEEDELGEGEGTGRRMGAFL